MSIVYHWFTPGIDLAKVRFFDAVDGPVVSAGGDPY